MSSLCPNRWLIAGALLLAVSAEPASARDGFAAPGIRPGSGGFSSVSTGGPRHGWHHSGRRGRGIGVYLDRDRGSVVNVSLRQTFVQPVVSPFFVPSVTDLPAVAGIREARPAEAAVYVLNEARPAASAPRLSSGPRIVQVEPGRGGSDAGSDNTFGARIIHLDVPVGRRN